MKKLILSAAIMLASLTVFSQTGTAPIITDSIVPLPKNVAKEVVKDLLRKDSLQSEVNTCLENQILYEKNLELKDSVISSKSNQILLYQEKEKNYDTIIQLKDLQKQNLESAVDVLKNDLKKTNRKLFNTQVGSVALILFLGYLLVK